MVFALARLGRLAPADVSPMPRTHFRPSSASALGAADPCSESLDRPRPACATHEDLERALRRYSERMLTVARRIVGDESDACDAYQDALVSALKSAQRFRGESEVATWLHRITVNAALMRLRARRRRSAWEALAAQVDPRAAAARTDESARESAVLDEVAAAEERGRVRAALALLGERDRRVIVGRYFDGLDTQALASRLGISPGAAKLRLHRGIKRLGRLLEPARTSTDMEASL